MRERHAGGTALKSLMPKERYLLADGLDMGFQQLVDLDASLDFLGHWY
jgi:hypothetical protein